MSLENLRRVGLSENILSGIGRLWRNGRLASGSVAASCFNFYNFAIFPNLHGLKALEIYIKENYFGGLYLVGIASSVAPFTAHILAVGGTAALSKYARISLFLFIAICVTGMVFHIGVYGYICLASAVLLHANGFMLGAIIKQKRVVTVVCLQVVQPALFAIFITLNKFVLGSRCPWSLLFLASCMIAALAFALCTNWGWLRHFLRAIASARCSYTSMLQRVVLGVLVSVYLQVQLIICGTQSHAFLGQYAIAQRLYASIATSLTGTISIFLLNQQLETRAREGSGWWKKVLFLGGFASLGVMLVGGVLLFSGNHAKLTLGIVGLCAVLAFLYAISSFITLKSLATKPGPAMRAIVASAAVVAGAELILKPEHTTSLLLFDLALLSAYIILARRSVSDQFRYAD